MLAVQPVPKRSGWVLHIHLYAQAQGGLLLWHPSYGSL